MPSPWVQRMVREAHAELGAALKRSRHPRCAADTLKGARCKRSEAVRISTIPIVGYCRQHGRRMADREVARYMNTRRVTVEEVQR